MRNKTLLLSLAASLLFSFGACKKDEKKVEEDKKEGVAPLEVSNQQRGFLGYVGATWCPPCVKLKSQVQSEIRTKKAILTYLDKDEYPKAYAKINPKTIPHIQVYRKLRKPRSIKATLRSLRTFLNRL